MEPGGHQLGVQDPTELLQSAAVEAGEQLARRYFQWPRLRSFQRRALEAWAAQRPCLVLSATGSGKSGCFALPALVERHWRPELPAAALVVSPLVALMHDQADRLRLRGLGAVVCSPQGGLDFQTALQAVHGGALVVFMAPETAVREASRKTLRQLRVALVAIDEAHCVSEWGHDFRAEYSQLSLVIQDLAAGRGGRTPPVMALTATCRREVREDVMSSLGLAGAEQILGSMNRPNLHYSVEELADEAAMLGRLRELFAAEGGAAERRARPIERHLVSQYSPTIVYCVRKRDAERVAAVLLEGGVSAAAFHAEKSSKERMEIQEAFGQNRLQAVVATVAFGMGIDKPDVRRVVHYFMPNSLEAYMQESGRAGRDGLPGSCTLLFTKVDRRSREQALLHQEISPALRRNMMRCQASYFYCCNRHLCRRAQLLSYLGEEPLAHFAQPLCSQPAPLLGTPGFCFQSSGTPCCGRCDTCDLMGSRAVMLEDVSEELTQLLGELTSGGRKGRCALVTKLRRRLPRRSNEEWQRVMDLAIHEELVTLELFGGQGMAFAAPQLTAKGREWLLAPYAMQGDLGRRRRPVALEPPETLDSVPEPTVADEPQSQDAPLVEALEEELPVAFLKAKRKAGGLLAQATPQRRRRGSASDGAAELEVMEEVQKLRQLLEESRLPRGCLSTALHELRKLRAVLQASVQAASCEVASPDAISVASGDDHRTALVPRKLKGKAKATRGKAAVKFSQRERQESSPFLQKLMDAAELNSNQQGGSEQFRSMISEAKRLAPAQKRKCLEEVVQKHFLAKTPGRHRERLRQIIIECKAEGL